MQGMRERRRVPRERPSIPVPAGRTPSGLEPPEAIAAVVDALEDGDAVFVVHLAGDSSIDSPFERLAYTDRLLAVARELRIQLRAQDRLGIEGNDLVAILLDGGRAAVDSLWRRLEAAHDRANIGGVLSAGWAMHEDIEPAQAVVSRAVAAAQRSIGQPPGDRLWAG
jgi:hypothetical protein